jgi:hypothetical protein
MEAKEFYKSKTFWVNLIAFAIALLSAFGLVGEMDEGLEPFVVPVVALINIALRFVTKQAVKLG